MRLPRIPTVLENSSNILLPRQDDTNTNNSNNQETTIITTTTNPSVAIIVFTVILAITLFFVLILTLYCVLSKRWASKRRDIEAAHARPPRTAEITTEIKPITKKSGGKRVPTLVFQQHEPDAHGYFAPLYLSREGRRSGGVEGMDEDRLADVKRDVLEVFDPAILEVMGEEKKKKADERVSVRDLVEEGKGKKKKTRP
jgi:hypothetical protein